VFRRRFASFSLSAVVLLVAATFAPLVAAQDATPGASPAASPGASPVASPGASPAAGTGETIRSIAREEYTALLTESFNFEEPQNRGGQLIQGELSDISTTNPMLVDDVYSRWIADLVSETLVNVSPVDGAIVPGLADAYEIAPDGVTYTFSLNEAARWHDGQDLTAQDFVLSLDFATAGESVFAYTSDFQNKIASYRAVDDDTLEIVSEGPIASFLYDIGNAVYPMPTHLWGDVPFTAWAADPGSTGQDPARVVGTGPFRFVEWRQGDSVTLARNDDYWDAARLPVIDEYVYRVLPDENTIVQALLTGEIDVFENIPPAQVQAVVDGENTEVRTYDTLGFNWYAPNQTLPIFQDPAVRQAMLFALDRQLIAEEIYLGFAEVANGTQPVLSPSYDPDAIETVYNFDPDRARQLLADAGWTDSDGDGTVDKDLNGDGTITEDEQLRFDFIYTEGVAIYDQMVPYMQQAWAEVGIDMLPQAIPFPTLSQRVDDGDFGVALYGFTWSPDGGQGLMYRCDAFAPEGFNAMRYCNEQYDQLDTEMSRTLDPEARIALQKDLSNIVNNDAANGVIVFRQRNSGYSVRVHNFFPTGFSFAWTIPYVWVEPQ